MYLTADVPESSHVVLRIPELYVVGLVQGEKNFTGIEGKVGEGAVLNQIH